MTRILAVVVSLLALSCSDDTENPVSSLLSELTPAPTIPASTRGPCFVGMQLRPGESCSIGETGYLFRVEDMYNGRGCVDDECERPLSLSSSILEYRVTFGSPFEPIIVVKSDGGSSMDDPVTWTVVSL